MGAWAIMGAFRTVSTAVAKAEASLQTIHVIIKETGTCSRRE
ncbi:hypothetical protein S40285_10905 [Stachybotrys chlorohalonatus IBT 40285]|uniref:Uncharacterized protein n=1 Tax=Stachybotrys chlorohalonatus (strain IBT 40285) TaxID=1283841 RepID=A0A084QXP1_STAC4|nr:hypothetical protein S40285_10905 [Stachybotrys chlorohalonata IBT 40285]